jgi:hypothetical protein
LEFALNNCEFSFESYSNVLTPLIQIKLYKDDGKFMNEDNAQYNAQSNFIYLDTNVPMRNCLIRFLIPQNDTNLKAITIKCRGKCSIRNISDSKIVFEELNLISQNLSIALENFEIKKLTINCDYVSIYFRKFKISSSFVYALIGILDWHLDLMEDFSFFLLGTIEVENLVKTKSSSKNLHFDKLRDLFKSGPLQAQLNEYFYKNSKFNVESGSWPMESDILVPAMSYNTVSESKPLNIFYIEHLALSLKTIGANFDSNDKDFPSEINKPRAENMVIVPSFDNAVKYILDERKANSSVNNYILNMQFSNLINRNAQFINGAYFQNGISSFLVSAFLDMINPEKIISNLYTEIQVSVFYPYIVVTKSQESLVLSAIATSISDRITKILVENGNIQPEATNKALAKQFFILNSDDEYFNKTGLPRSF